jgi:hypothetical protein
MCHELDTDTRNIYDADQFEEKVTTVTISNALYYYGDRSFNVIHAQLRLNYQLHVSDDPTCICSHKVEDTNHFFFDCLLYYTHRLKLMQVLSTYSTFTLEVLLYGDPHLNLHTNQILFAAVHDYIKESDRFVTVNN